MLPEMSYPETLSGERNRLLATLSSSTLDAILPRFEQVHLEQKQVIGIAGEVLEYAVFPRTAVMSLLAPMENGESVESATVGLEGMVGLPLFLGDGIGLE